MSMGAPPTRTPPRPIRPDGEIPDSQDDDEQHYSDFEDLLEEGRPAVPLAAVLPAAETHAILQSNERSQPTPSLNLSLPSTATHTLRLPPPFPTSSIINAQPHPSPPPPPPSTSTPKHARLHSQIADLQSKISEVQSQLAASNAKLSDPSRADSIVKAHIKLLHQYNEIKDVGLGLMGLIADGRAVRVGDVMEEFGVGVKD